MMNTKYLLMLFLLMMLAVIGNAQDSIETLPLNSETLSQFQSAYQLNFSDVFLLSENPSNPEVPLDTEINLGWFTYSPSDERFLLLDEEQTLLATYSDGATTYTVPAVNVVDAVTFGDRLFAILFATEDGFSVWYDNMQLYGGSGLHINVTSDALPSAIWVTCPDDSTINTDNCRAGVEATLDSETIVYTLPAAEILAGNTREISLSDSDLTQIPYAPNQDDDAVVRIGRIPLPYVVTSSLTGIVKLWNIETGEILYEVDNSTGEPSVFGNINADATHLVWRDNMNQTLYLLNFETGENREIAPLNGDYAQWYFLSNDASIIVAVNLGSQPNVIAWDTATGERTNLGDYRQCERPQPDRVAFTADGSALVIGCDTGLDIWQVIESE